MQNYGLEIHSDKIWPDSNTKYTLKYLTTSSADLPKQPKYLGYLKNKLSLGAVVCGLYNFHSSKKSLPLFLRGSSNFRI